MKKILVFLLGMMLGGYANAQLLDINPNVNWKYVRSQTLELQNESIYQYEFPAEKGYDYIFNMYFPAADLITYISVYDMQMKPISSSTNAEVNAKSQLKFSVSESGTYIVTLGFKNKQPSQTVMQEIELALIRREFVE